MSPKSNAMRRLVVFALLSLLIFSLQAFGQAASSIGGTVMDTSQAVLPGASITATNTQTGVATKTTSNSAGVYNFPSLQPGVYNVAAEVKGFQTATKTDVKLGMAAQVRLNFELVVAGVATEVQVTTSAENLMLESGSSTGTVLQEDSVTELPLVSNDVMDLINIMGGVVKAENPIFANSDQTFAGVSGANINIQRDGISVNEIRYNSGIVSPLRINPEMVGEFKMVLSPVDAEMGRGAGQVQMLTKSGANAFHGSGVWNFQNTVLDANEWENKNQVPIVEPNWRNLNNYTLSASGPIIKNKTFFFVTWDQQIVRTRGPFNARVLTPCARKGIFRYLSGWINQNATYTDVVANQRAVVDYQGQPRLTNPDGSQSQLLYQSVLGQLTADARAQVAADPYNCSQYDFTAANHGITANTAWDTNRNTYDQSGFIDRFTTLMPEVNNWETGDGLNTAGHRWNRTLKGSDTVFGSGEDNLRKSITVKLDHNISAAHRVSGTYTYESDLGEDAYAAWPRANGGYGGKVDRQPQSFTVTVTSTLRPTLLNEARVGLSRTRTHTNEPLRNPETGKKMREVLDQLMPTTAENFPNYTGYPLIVGPGFSNTAFWTENSPNSHPYGSRGNMPTTWGGVDPRWSLSDTITWTRGAHSFKGGFEFRRNKSWQESNGLVSFSNGANTFPSVKGGIFDSFTPIATGALASWAGLMGDDRSASSTGNFATAYGLLSYMAGSVGRISQYFYVNSAKNPTWNNAGEGQLNYITDLRNREFSFFFKDDWKVNSALTLNLGMRYEYYGVPWVDSGMAAGVERGVAGLFGLSGGDFSTWMPENPAVQGDDYLTKQIFVGPNSPNSGIDVFHKDKNNFAPHVGFSWQLPWFGKGKTTMRGGYSISYTAVSNFDNTFGYAGYLANAPGTTYVYQFEGDASHPYLNFSNLGSVIPLELPAGIQPMAVRSVQERSQPLTMYDPNIRNPYIQNLTLSLTRNIGNTLTVDVRYIGTLSRKSVGGINLNSVNFINNGLFDEFATVRAGGESALLNQYIQPGTLWYGFSTGSQQLRSYYGTNYALASGDFASLANTLATTNGIMPVAATVKGAVLRRGGAPENFIYTNPQYASATLQTNRGHSNYHSMQAQVTLRPTRGLSFQTTYTWSRNLTSSGVTDWREGSQDYWLASQHRTHNVSTYGTFDLPFGANGFMFRNAAGVFKKAIEGWQLSWIASMTSGLPQSIGMGTLFGIYPNNKLWGNSSPDLVAPQYWDNKSGKVTWARGAASGRYWGDTYVKVADPQCNNTNLVVASLASTCAGFYGLRALALASDPTKIVFQNPLPGERGNFQPMNLTGPGRWSLDMAMGKSIEFMEGKRFDIRVDAQNIFNHPTPSNGITAWNARFTQIYNPNSAMNGGDSTFGFISSKGGHRTFQAKVRISF